MDPTPQQQIARMLTGYWISQAIYVAAKLGISDLLADGPKEVEQLAASTDTDAEALYRLLRGLSSIEIFAEEDERHFRLTPLAETLRSDVAGSQRALALMMGDEHYRVWGELLYSVRTGEVAFDKIFGKPIFEYLAENPDSAEIFDAAMTGIHGRETQLLLDAYDFSSCKTIADIGGGNGTQLTAILQKYPDARGILFDLPHVVERAQPKLDAAGMTARCQAVGGDFIQSVPAGADAYVLRRIIHDWDDENAIVILKQCCEAMSPGGKVLMVESVIPPGNEPFFGKLLDLTMLLIPGGMERTADEYRELLDDAGLQLMRIIPTEGDISVIEAEKRYPQELM